VHLFSIPAWLPVCIALDYYTLWTKDRMQEIIIAAKTRNIAIAKKCNLKKEDFFIPGARV
jgi:hypothetical protein